MAPVPKRHLLPGKFAKTFPCTMETPFPISRRKKDNEARRCFETEPISFFPPSFSFKENFSLKWHIFVKHFTRDKLALSPKRALGWEFQRHFRKPPSAFTELKIEGGEVAKCNVWGEGLINIDLAPETEAVRVIFIQELGTAWHLLLLQHCRSILSSQQLHVHHSEFLPWLKQASMVRKIQSLGFLCPYPGHRKWLRPSLK